MSILCVLSDTHDSHNVAKQAANRIREIGPEAVIHCGDLESSDMLDIFSGLPMSIVFGNCDWDTVGIRKKAESLGFPEIGHSIQFSLEGKEIFALHGDNGLLLQHAVQSEEFDYIFHGHTHQKTDYMNGKTRIICPGALYRATPFTFAVVDLKSGECSFETVAAK